MGGAGQRLHAGGTVPARRLRAGGSGCARSIATLMCRWRGGREGPGCHQLSGWHLLGLPTHLPGSGGPRGSRGCGFMWRLWKAPGKARALSMRLVPSPGLLPKKRPGGNSDNYAMAGLERLGLPGPCFWPK